MAEDKVTFVAQLYSDYAYFSQDRIFFQDLNSETILFETRNEFGLQNHKFMNYILATDKIISNWDDYFNQIHPNALINGFDEKSERRFLFLSVYDPQLEDNLVSFRYDLNKVEDQVAIKGYIEKWNREGDLQRVSLLLDRILAQF